MPGIGIDDAVRRRQLSGRDSEYRESFFLALHRLLDIRLTSILRSFLFSFLFIFMFIIFIVKAKKKKNLKLN